jgi:hypothetical protein
MSSRIAKSDDFGTWLSVFWYHILIAVSRANDNVINPKIMFKLEPISWLITIVIPFPNEFINTGRPQCYPSKGFLVLSVQCLS